MPNNRHLWFFVAVMLAGMVLALFAKSQLTLLLWVAGLLLLPVVALAGFIVLTGLPQGQRQAGPSASTTPQGLGAPWMVLAATLAVIALFAIWPGLDLAIARTLFRPASGFAGRGWLGEIGRFVGYMVPFLVLAGFVLAWSGGRLGWPMPFSPKGRDVLFVGLAMLLGPGLIVNLGMKDHLHRPRPSQIQEFGGGREYRAFYQFDGSCPKNCSFPSGEAAEAFWMMGPASLAPAPLRPQAMAAALVFGVAVSALRMAFGGHFLSDVVFAGLIMWALLLVLRRLLYPPVETHI